MLLGKLLILAKQIALMPSFICEFKKYLYNFLKNLTSKQPFAVIYFNRHLAKTYVHTYTNFNINVGISDVGFFEDQKPQKDFSRYFKDFKHQRKLYNYVDH